MRSAIVRRTEPADRAISDRRPKRLRYVGSEYVYTSSGEQPLEVPFRTEWSLCSVKKSTKRRERLESESSSEDESESSLEDGSENDLEGYSEPELDGKLDSRCEPDTTYTDLTEKYVPQLFSHFRSNLCKWTEQDSSEAAAALNPAHFGRCAHTAKTNQAILEFVRREKTCGDYIVIGDAYETVQNADCCLFCKFLSESLGLFSSDGTWRIGFRAQEGENQISLVSGSKPWFNATGMQTEMNVKGCDHAWMKLGRLPAAKALEPASFAIFDDSVAVCVSLSSSDAAETLQPTRTNLDTGVVYPRRRAPMEGFNGNCHEDLILCWLKICDEHHKWCKNGSPNLPNNFNLIDVETLRVVPYSQVAQNEKFATLSYVWGAEQQHQNVSTFKSPMTLPEYIPKTIYDAIEFTSRLKLRYLWVDMFCIDQTNDVTKREQIEGMDAIFQASYMTLVCLDGAHSDHGLGGVSNPIRQAKQPWVKIGGDRLMATSIHNQSEHMSDSPWEQRAWTLQERLLSRRCLFFSDKYYSMNCKEEFFHELITPEINIAERRHGCIFTLDGPDLTLDRKDFRMYANLVSAYTRRDITDQRDIYNACRGFLKRLEANSEMKFNYGIPHSNFGDHYSQDKYLAAGLLWDELTDTSERTSQVTLRSAFPTWTWLEWNMTCGYPEWLLDNLEAEWSGARSACEESLSARVVKSIIQIKSEVAHFDVERLTDPSAKEFWALKDGSRKTLSSLTKGTAQRPGRDKIGFFPNKDQVWQLKRKHYKVDLILIKRWRSLNIGGKVHENAVSALVTYKDFEDCYRRLACVLMSANHWQNATRTVLCVNLV